MPQRFENVVCLPPATGKLNPNKAYMAINIGLPLRQDGRRVFTGLGLRDLLIINFGQASKGKLKPSERCTLTSTLAIVQPVKRSQRKAHLCG